MARTSDDESISQARELLTGVGLRSTAARMAVLRWLQTSKTPSTHAEIALDLTPMGFDKATIFRNLNDLTEAGLVTRTELGDHVWRFEIRDKGHSITGQHPHFVCVDCGQVTCLNDLDLPKAALQQLSRVGNVTEILVRGHCLTCS